MHAKFKPIVSVPTNIITGFLGVGKTSAILNLLKHKPGNERWAVLVNEFGEIGIDGALIGGHSADQNGVFIREVPGGCMCCAAGLPMQVALTKLIKKANPDRLLIEPTGLGHPREVLQTLQAQSFREVLSIQKIVTLIDARALSDKRYTDHETFKQQIDIADVIVANKRDLYSADDERQLKRYLAEHSSERTKLIFTERGIIDPNVLDGRTSKMGVKRLINSTRDSTAEAQDDYADLPECGYLKAVNQGEGFISVGWRFASQYQFNRDKLFNFLHGVEAERLKAVFLTDEGSFAYNLTRDTLSEVAIDPLDESKIEIITREPKQDWETELFNCATGHYRSDKTSADDRGPRP